MRPEPFGSEPLDMSLQPELRPSGSSTCLKAELLIAEGRPKGSAERKGKASPYWAMGGLERRVFWFLAVRWLRNICINVRMCSIRFLLIETRINRIGDGNGVNVRP